jgi:maltose alpha-D-glucosyltransferase/alpha-amylase
VFRELREKASLLSPRARQQTDLILPREAELFRRFEPLLHMKMAALRTRVHGNLHLGKVLYTGRSFVLIGAGKGEERSLNARRRKRSPLRDPTLSLLMTLA